MKGAIEEADKMYKAWVTLYTCATSRAITLDVVPRPNSDCFIRSFHRFIARRGCPTHTISDNAKNFVAEETQTFIANKGVEWHLNLPLAPWYGGFFERLVRSTKELLKKELVNSRYTYEEIQTILYEIEAILNNRPLTYVYPNSLEDCITPNHLLFGRKLSLTSPSSSLITDTYENPDYPSVVNKAINHFYSRWKKEYLVNLRETHKLRMKNSHQPIANVSDVVLIHDEQVPRSQWRMGVIIKLIKGHDNEVRGAVVRCSNKSELKRSLTKLYPIEYVECDQQRNEENENYIDESDENEKLAV